jgi:hypothetical protein
VFLSTTLKLVLLELVPDAMTWHTPCSYVGVHAIQGKEKRKMLRFKYGFCSRD